MTIQANKLDSIFNSFPDEDFMLIDGFDDAVIGVDTDCVRLVYDVSKMVEILCEGGMDADDAIDYLVIGTSGATGWESFFMGTNASSIITDAGIPVYCVPSDASFQKIDTIGFTTRFRPKDKKALQTVLQLAHKAKAKVKCLYVKTSNSDISNATIAEWKEEYKSEPIDFFIIEDDDVQAIITDFIMYKEVDVLIMLPYKRGFFEGLFHTSLTKKLATDFEIPILSIPINE